MVKGISRRVVVVRPDDGRVFEQAIFIVRDGGVQKHDVLREACAVAERYLKSTVRRAPYRRYTRLQLLCAGGVGAALTGIAWALAALLL